MATCNKYTTHLDEWDFTAGRRDHRFNPLKQEVRLNNFEKLNSYLTENIVSTTQTSRLTQFGELIDVSLREQSTVILMLRQLVNRVTTALIQRQATPCKSVNTKCGGIGGLSATSQGKPRILAFNIISYRRVHLEKLIVAEMCKILPSACVADGSLSCSQSPPQNYNRARWIWPAPPHIIALRSVSILSYLRLRL
jgi:hypothetical protein